MSITGGSSGSGGGVVNVTVTPNSAADVRTGTLTVAGLPVSVRQDGVTAACTLDISPSTASFTKDAATGSFAIIAPDHCPWSATSAVAWLTVTSGNQGSGNGRVAFAVERNRTVTARTAGIVVEQRTFIVTQAGDTGGCQYSVTPIEFNACMSVPYELTATITTESGCTWTAEPGASWMTVTGGQSGSGSGAISFKVSDNWDAPRHGVVMVRWPTPTAGQNLQVSQAGCRYAVSTSVVDIGAAGGPGRFDVFQQSDPYTCGGPLQNGCMWIAQSDVSWITVTTPTPQYGDNPVSFTVAANPGSAARLGTITVRDKTVRITQAGR